MGVCLFSECINLYQFRNSLLLVLLLLLFNCCSDGPTQFVAGEVFNDDREEVEEPILELNLRIHIMRDIIIPHPSGIDLYSWVTSDDVKDIIVPEMNVIWGQANIKWVIDSIIDEDVVKGYNYDQSINYIANCVRDAEGHSDPARLVHLYSLMQPQNRSQADEIGKNLFHIYIWPFVGNTSQGNAMKSYDCHSIVGSWSNKHNKGGTPEKFLLFESHIAFDRGSISRTASHELGHVLNLRHDECLADCLMSGGSNGYSLTKVQISEARATAMQRILASN